MNSISYVKKAITTSACIALCVVLPMAFHSIPNAGNIFLPMHIPVLLCGLICGWPFGLLCGIFGPLISSVMTSMPPAPVLPGMLVELAVYGVVAGIMMKIVHTGRIYPDLYISLIAAQATGKIATGIAKALVFARGEYSITVWVSGHLVTAWPGILIQLILIPSIVYALEKASLIPSRYPHKTL